jgi:hypothetical protein
MKFATLLVVGMAAALVGCGGEKKTASGQGKLTLARPSDVVLVRGDSSKVKVHCTRGDLPGDVWIRFDDLPAGVSVVEKDDRLAREDGTFTLRASETAALVNRAPCKITATSERGPTATETFFVSVNDVEIASGR